MARTRRRLSQVRENAMRQGLAIRPNARMSSSDAPIEQIEGIDNVD
jgi:hypothetical protein